jgi:hypothetical protein
MNPKEVSYSHPQLPLCDTPICLQIQSLTGIETQKYRFFVTMQVQGEKKVLDFNSNSPLHHHFLH